MKKLLLPLAGLLGMAICNDQTEDRSEEKPKKRRNFTRELQKEIAERLKEYGFKKKEIFLVKKISPIITWGLGISFSSFNSPHRRVLIHLELENSEINKITTMMTGFYTKEFWFSANTMLHRPGHVLGWEFRSDMDNSAMMDDMINAIVERGIPILERLSTLDGMISYFEETNEDFLLLPKCYYLKGEKQKGIEMLERKLEEIKNDEIWVKSLSEYLEQYKALD